MEEILTSGFAQLDLPLPDGAAERFQAVFGRFAVPVVQAAMGVQPAAQRAVVRTLRRGDEEKIKRAEQKESNQKPQHRQSSPASNTSSLSLGISVRLSPWRVRLIVTNEQATMNAA